MQDSMSKIPDIPSWNDIKYESSDKAGFPSYENTKTKKSTQMRASKVCVYCHDRKVRCNVSVKPEGQPCTNCNESGTECVIYKRKKRVCRKKSDLLHPDKFWLYSGFEQDLPEFVEPSLQKESLHVNTIKLDPNVVLKKNFGSLLRIEHSLFNSNFSCINDIVEDLILDSEAQGRNRSYRLDEYDFQMLNMYGCFNLPDERTCWTFINNFFLILNPQLPIIDKNQFYEDYKDLRNPPSLLLLYSVLYVGARHSDTVNTSKEELLYLDKICRVMFKRAKVLYDLSIETEPIPLIQSLLCLIWNYENSSLLCKNDYYWTNLAIQSALRLGFHKDNDLNPTLSPYEKLMYKRLFWCLHIKDKLVGLGFATPFMIDLDDCDVSMLQESDLKDTDLSEAEASYFISFIRFANLVDDVVKEQAKMNKLTRSEDLVQSIKQCDQMLISWLEEVPYYLKFRLDDPSTHSFLSGLLTSQYYTLLILTHKANIQRGLGDQYPSWAISFQAAQMVKLIADSMIEHGFLIHVALISHNTLYASTIIMLYHLMNEDKQVARIAEQFFLNILKIWEISSVKWPSCYPMWFIFNRLYSDDAKKRELLNSLVGEQQSKNTMIVNSNGIMLPLPNYHTIYSGPNLPNHTQQNVKMNIPSAQGYTEPYGHSTAHSSKIPLTPDKDLDKLFTNNVFSQSKTLLPKLNLAIGSQLKRPQSPSNKQEPVQSSATTSSDIPVSLWLMNASWQPNFTGRESSSNAKTPATTFTKNPTKTEHNRHDHNTVQLAPPNYDPSSIHIYHNHEPNLMDHIAQGQNPRLRNDYANPAIQAKSLIRRKSFVKLKGSFVAEKEEHPHHIRGQEQQQFIEWEVNQSSTITTCCVVRNEAHDVGHNGGPHSTQTTNDGHTCSRKSFWKGLHGNHHGHREHRTNKESDKANRRDHDERDVIEQPEDANTNRDQGTIYYHTFCFKVIKQMTGNETKNQPTGGQKDPVRTCDVGRRAVSEFMDSQ
ncbi:hypothetical protein OGAPHI_004299 [Ogataea philodendri]|uniref:Zn(2)-C6 fungal-type domain-containing protein n=1 Tax=Ogataea philodendri TaxID=1378263 RepID=A0A9P8T5H6_9ASCO|nr:uncharacterized protein OGAPHI_004299 [Ogataea philodendri]KAH3666110.1 hypothetical protein OGAPHI_004299 [Ogataea philodendri]